jgi:hypothetical protein
MIQKILSAAVLGEVEGSCLEVRRRFGKPRGSSTSRLEPSTTASTPALRMLLAAAILITGCHGPGKEPTSKPTPAQTMQMSVTISPQDGSNPGDPQPAINAMVHLDIYMLDLPPGTVSDNRDFWKRADELAVGVANADRLKANGIRCGVVPRSEGLYFSHFFDLQPAKARRQTVDGIHTDTLELDMEKPFDRQDLFFFSGSNPLEGRTYEKGKNKLALTFGPTPRDPGAVRLTLCPIVYSERTEMHFTALNQEYETQEKGVDHIYDLGLTADVPGDSFMIIAPSSDAVRRTSIGGRFLVKEDQSDKLEQVIVIVPTFVRLDGKPYLVRQPLINSNSR